MLSCLVLDGATQNPRSPQEVENLIFMGTTRTYNTRVRNELGDERINLTV